MVQVLLLCVLVLSSVLIPVVPDVLHVVVVLQQVNELHHVLDV